MMFAGIFLILIGCLWAAFKGYIVWDVAHDLYNGGGVPTLDFPIFCPMPIAVGVSLVLRTLGKLPFPGFGFAVYLGLVLLFGVLHWLFNRIGTPERERQLEAIKKKQAEAE